MAGANRKTAMVLFLLRLIRLMVSVLTLSVSAQYFGVGLERESWLLALNFVTLIQLALWGPLNETFRAKFIFIRTAEGTDAALSKGASVFYFSLFVMAVVVVIFELIATPVAHFIAPAIQPEDIQLLVALLRITLWTAIINQACQLLISLLNTYDSFYLPEISAFISGIINLILIIYLSPIIGIYAFVWAQYVALLLLLAVLIYQIKKSKIPFFKFKINGSWSATKPFILYAIPFFLPYLAGQANSLAEKTLANLIGHNSVSIIDYSKKISDIIQSVLSGVLTTLMVPIIAQHFSKKDISSSVNEASRYLHLLCLVLALIIPGLYFNAPEICTILYNKGSISMLDLTKIQQLIQIYAFSLLSIFAYLIFGLLLLATEQNKVYAFWGLIAQIVMLVFNLLFYQKFELYTFAFALIISHSISAYFMWRKIPLPKKEILSSSSPYLIHFTLVFVATWVLLFWLPNIQNTYLSLGLKSSSIMISFVLIGWGLKLPEIKNYKQLLNINKSPKSE